MHPILFGLTVATGYGLLAAATITLALLALGRLDRRNT